MTERSPFYQEITEITERRINELIQHAQDMEGGEHASSDASAYFRAHALAVYLAWRDVADGLYTRDDLERVEQLAQAGALMK